MSTAHPARYSEEVIETFRAVLPRTHWHDPFAGSGERLGRLADQVGAVFSGVELEPEFIVDQRVHQGDSTAVATYPVGLDWIVVTSPTYCTRMADYPNGPTARTNPKGRRSYGMALGRALAPTNSGRYGPRQIEDYVALHREAVRWWPAVAVVNVSDSIQAGTRLDVVDRWVALLEDSGYRVEERIQVPTPRYRYGANSERRVDGEQVLVACRSDGPS